MAQALRSPFFFIAVLLVVGALGVVFLRQQLADFILTRVLAQQGFQVESLTVDDFGFGGLRLRDVRLGPPDGLIEVDSLTAAYRPLELLDGRIRRLQIEGLRVLVDLTAEPGPFPFFQSLNDKSEGTTGNDGRDKPPLALPEIVVTRGLIAVRSTLGTQQIAFSGAAMRTSALASAIRLDADLEGELARGRTALAADVTADWDIADWDVKGTASLQDVALALPAAKLAGITGQATFDLPGGRISRIHGQIAAESLSLAVTEQPVPPFRQAQLTFDIGPDSASAEGRLASADGAFQGDLAARLADDKGVPILSVEVGASAAHDSDLWAAFALPQPQSGRQQLRLHAKGRLPSLDDWSGALLDPQVAAFIDGSRLSWSAEDLSYDGRISGLNAALEVAGRVEDDKLTLALAKDATLTAAAVSPAVEQAIGLPAALSPALPGPVALTLSAEGERPFALTLGLGQRSGPRPLTLALALTAEGLWGGHLALVGDLSAEVDDAFAPHALAVDDVRLTGEKFDLPTARLGRIAAKGNLAGGLDSYSGEVDLQLDGLTGRATPLAFGGGAADISLRLSKGPEGFIVVSLEPAQASLNSLVLPGLFQLQAPLTLTLPDARLQVSPEGPSDLSPVAAQLKLVLPKLSGLIYSGQGQDATAHEVEAETAGLTLDLKGADWATAAITAEAELAALRLPGEALAATDFRIEAKSEGGLENIRAAYSLGALRHAEEPAAFAPLAVKGRIERRDKDVDFTAEGTWADVPAVATAIGWHDLNEGTGGLEGRIEPPDFTPGGLQPTAFVPVASALEKVSGKAEATLRLDWDADTVDSLGRVVLSDMGFTASGVKFRGVNTSIDFVDLFALESLPQQVLTVARIDAGLPITDINLRYRLDPAMPSGLRLGKGAFSVLGAQIGLTGNTAPDSGSLQDLTFSVRDLQLEKLFQVIDADGFSGSGLLAGRIPVALKADTLVIREAHLDATGPGRLQIRSEAATAMLEGGGEQAALLLEALEDFHYEKLSMTLANTAENDLDLTLSILGNNPDVLDGHPFQLNINLESNIERLLDALLAGYRLSIEALQRLWSLRP